MNILLFSFYYPPDLCAGSFRLSALVNSLKQKTTRNDNITIITTYPNRYHSFKAESVPAYEEIDNVSIYRIKIPSHKSGMLDQTKSFWVYYKEALKISRKIDSDLVFATSSRLFTAFLGARVARILRKPLYLDIRDIFIDTLLSISRAKHFVLSPFLNLIESYTIQTASRINLVSLGFKSYFERKYPSKEFSYFTNGIDPEFQDISFNNLVSKNRKTILYAGNMGQGQGLDKIVPDLAKLLEDEFDIEIIGDGGTKQILKKKLIEQNINNVILSKPIDRGSLINKYKEATILFLHLNNVPAFEKVLPSKLFEYAATGKPILAGVNGFSKEFINSEIENAAVFSPCDASSAVSAIVKLKKELVNRSEFKKKYDRSNIMEKLSLDIISTLDV